VSARSFILALLLFQSACAAATLEQLRRRASFDLDCPEGELEVVELDERTKGVRGCGRRATYIEHCDRVYTEQTIGAQSSGSTAKTDCTWVMNSAGGQPVRDQMDQR
jgi:hypothetical protein